MWAILGAVSDAFFNRHKAVRRLLVLWAMLMITWVVKALVDPSMAPLITSPWATVAVAVIGILATVLGFYQWSRGQESKSASDSD